MLSVVELVVAAELAAVAKLFFKLAAGLALSALAVFGVFGDFAILEYLTWGVILRLAASTPSHHRENMMVSTIKSGNHSQNVS